MCPLRLTAALVCVVLGFACGGASSGSGSAPPPDDPAASSTRAQQGAIPETIVEVREEEQETSAAQPAGDPDGDGIAGSADLCPHDPEDADGDRDGDGCPDRSVADAPVAP